MRKLAVSAMAAVAVMAAAGRAEAVPIVFSTSGSFASGGGCTAAGTTTTCGAYTITYTPMNVNIDVPLGFSSFTNFGSFAVSGGGSGTPLTGVGGTFALTITQTVPGPGNTVFSSTLNGTLIADSSQAFIQFAGPFDRLLGGVLYEMLEADQGTLGRANLPDPNTQAADIAGRVTPQAVIPEPGSMLLLGTGLLSLGRVARRRLGAK